MCTRRFLQVLLFFFTLSIAAQTPRKPTSSEIFHDLQKLNFIGSALYIAAHPDDENTALISHFVNHVHANTAYLSLTRGDGGQNLIGPELGDILGVIRTEELLEARKTDGGQQFFSRAIDFGYSKNPDETFEFWDHEMILSDVVHTIRKFRPDIIVNRFDHRSPGRTHGHHTASALLGVEAFDITDDASKFPESAKEFGTWQPQRLFFNSSWFFFGSKEKFEKADKSGYIAIETGHYFPLLGLSNGEIAAHSRSQHKSQGFGSTGVRGSRTEYLELLKGTAPSGENLFEGINTEWSRLKGGDAIAEILDPLDENFNFEDPSQILPQLLKAFPLISQLEDNHWREIKTRQLKELILNASGVFLEAVSKENSINPTDNIQLTIEAVNRGRQEITLKSIKDAKNNYLWNNAAPLLFEERMEIELTTPSQTPAGKYTSPYWLAEKGSVGMYNVPKEFTGLPEAPASEKIIFELQFGEITIPFEREIVYKFNDPVAGEVYRPLEVLPEVTATIPEKVLIFDDEQPRTIEVIVRAGRDAISGQLVLEHPNGWRVTPAAHAFSFKRKGKSRTFTFEVTPPKSQQEGYLKAKMTIGNHVYDKELVSIQYDHIPYKSVLLPSEAKIAKLDIQKRGQHIGYIHGAGDAVPESLTQIGYSVTTIDPASISDNNLQQYDAIVIGIRAYNTVPELAFVQTYLNNYVKNGGTLVVQYNTNHALVTEDLAPYSLTLSRDRVTDEFSEVKFLAPKHPVLNYPNEITQKDFEGWVQERGLYFPNKWAKEFTPILGMHDKGESQTKGSLLVAKHGKGHYIYTGLSFFRELPAGVPGAYRLFANLLSIGK